jgi:heat shock protein HtpX
LQRANSAVMEMCVDNPRHDFADLFDTHPPADARVEALVKFAGGHDPGPIALPPPGEEAAPAGPEGGTPAGGPWGEAEQPAQPSPWGEPAPAPAAEQQSKPFLPDRPPVDLGGSSAPPTGPWGPRRDS